MKPKDALDCKGKRIKTGGKVIFLSVEESLLSGLPPEDQSAIKAQKDKTHIVADIDERGYLEIEFEHTRPDSEVTYHTIWASPLCFEVIDK
jgi:hypothetical protein